MPRRPGLHRRRADPDRASPSCARGCRRSQQPVGIALFGLTATFAPAIGPTVGGWLTENLSWHYIFYLNVVPGRSPRSPCSSTRSTRSRRSSSELCQGDWLGIAGMAIGLPAADLRAGGGAAQGLVRLAADRGGSHRRGHRHRGLPHRASSRPTSPFINLRLLQATARSAARLHPDDRARRRRLRLDLPHPGLSARRSRATTPSRSARW